MTPPTQPATASPSPVFAEIFAGLTLLTGIRSLGKIPQGPNHRDQVIVAVEGLLTQIELFTDPKTDATIEEVKAGLEMLRMILAQAHPGSQPGGGTGGVYTFPLHANGVTIAEPYKQRWPENPMHDAEAQALYAPNDVVARLAAMMDGGNFIVMPHGVGVAVGDPEPVVIGTMDGTPLVPAQSPTA